MLRSFFFCVIRLLVSGLFGCGEKCETLRKMILFFFWSYFYFIFVLVPWLQRNEALKLMV